MSSEINAQFFLVSKNVRDGSRPAAPAPVGSFRYPIQKPPLGTRVVQRSAKFALGSPVSFLRPKAVVRWTPIIGRENVDARGSVNGVTFTPDRMTARNP